MMLYSGSRNVDDFEKNKEFYCTKLGFVFQENVNENNEKVLTLEYEDNLIKFVLISSLKDVRKDREEESFHIMQIEVHNLELEKNKISNNKIQILEWIPDKEFLFLDCNGFNIKYFQYEVANLYRDIL